MQKKISGEGEKEDWRQKKPPYVASGVLIADAGPCPMLQCRLRTDIAGYIGGPSPDPLFWVLCIEVLMGTKFQKLKQNIFYGASKSN